MTAGDALVKMTAHKINSANPYEIDQEKTTFRVCPQVILKFANSPKSAYSGIKLFIVKR
jgi:hypothetical protein